LKKGKPKIKIVSTLITLLVILLVIWAGPSSAISASVTVSDTSVAKGDLITFTATVQINSNERVPVRDFQLNIVGPTMTRNCTFYTNGSVKSGCTGVTTITQLSGTGTPWTNGTTLYNDSGYGYGLGIGYGYGQGSGSATPLYNFTYNITINTSSYSAALTPYSATLYAMLSNASAVRNVSSTAVSFNITYTNSSSGEVIPTNETYEVTNASQTIVIMPGAGVENITIPSNITSNASVEMDLSNTFNEDNNSVIEDELIIERETSTLNYTVEIPANTTIDGPDDWNGTMTLPTVQAIGTYSPPNGTTDALVEVGVSGVRLNFSDPVKIVIAGVGGKSAFWNDGTTTHAITTVCDSATSPTNVPTDGECYIGSGNDLIIWTYHFSIFGAYSPAQGDGGTSSGSSGGGGGGLSEWTTYYVSDENFQSGTTKSLKSKQRVRVSIDGESHYIGVESLASTSATISVKSEEQIKTLILGEYAKFDVTDDNYYDVYVRLDTISDNKAFLTIKKIHEKMPVAAFEEEEIITPTEYVEEAPTAQVVKKVEPEQAAQTPEAKDSVLKTIISNAWFWTAIAVIAILVLGAIPTILEAKHRKSKNNKKGKK
jgi:hypothetical protein